MIRFLALTILVTGAPSAALKADPGIEAPTREDVDDRTTDTRFLAAKPTPQVRLEAEEVKPPHPNMNTPPTADDGVAEEMQGQQLEDFLEQRQQMVDMRTAQAAQIVGPGQDTQHHLQPLPPQRQVPGSIADERPLTPDMVSQPKLWDDSSAHQVSVPQQEQEQQRDREAPVQEAPVPQRGEEVQLQQQLLQQEQEQRRYQEASVQEAPVPQRGQEVQLQQQLLQQEQEQRRDQEAPVPQPGQELQLQQQLLQQEQEQRRYQEAPVQEASVPQRGQEVQLQQQLLQQEQEQQRHQEAPVPQRGQEVQLQQQLLQQSQEQPVQQQMVVQGPGYQQQVAVPVAAQTYRHEHNRRNRRPVVQPTQQPVLQPTQQPVLQPTQQPVVQPTQQLVVQPMQQLPEAQSDRVRYVEPTPASEPATEIRPKGWSQCLKFARDVKKTGVTGPELVRVWEETCQPAVRSGRASDRYRLMCNSLSGAVRPFSAQLDYNVESLCDSVLAIFHDLTASRP